VEIETEEIKDAAVTSEILKGEDISLLTADNVQLAAGFYPPVSLNGESRVLLLLHEAYRDRSVWNDFIIAAQEEGFAVIALDLRGHGGSMGGKTFDQAMEQDVDAVLDWVSASPDLNEERVAIVGASLGANLALRAGARHPQINSLALLSPGMNYWEIGIESAMTEYGRRPVLLVASEGDGYAARSVYRLNEIGPGYDKMVIYSGTAHGTQLIRRQPDLIPIILDWFEQTMY
jgi:pimeloyl-ACP methyl ester carboxylesterase